MNLCDVRTIKQIMGMYGLHFKKEFGQNFLTENFVVEDIADNCCDDRNATILEIGPGLGTLTRELAARYKKVICLEIDTGMIPVLQYTLADFDNVTVYNQDVMQADLDELLADAFASGTVAVCANLPYYITTPLVTKLLEESDKVQGLSIMVQEEVADRFCAKENTPEYGSITAAIALKGSAKVVKRVSRNLFYPRPNVDSAVVKIEFERGRVAVKDEKAYRQTVKCAFLNRRKTLENNLVNFFKMSREEAKAALAEAGVEEKARGETLSPQRLAKLSDVLLDGGFIQV